MGFAHTFKQEGQEKVLHTYDHITFNSFVKLGNYFSKIPMEYVYAANASHCWVCAALPKSTHSDVLYRHIPLSYALSCFVVISVTNEVPSIWYDIADVALPLEMLNNNLDSENVWLFCRVFFKLTKANNNKTCELDPHEKF